MKERLAGFVLACALTLWLYWLGLITWFSLDDFAWLGLRLSVENAGDLVGTLFAPKAQGTVRPLSERLYFLVLEKLFGMDALPFRIVAFATQFLNLWLVIRLVERVTGSKAAGFLSALLWIVNSALALAMSWSSAYNQIMWPCFMLAACHARWTWLETGSHRARYLESLWFVLGFGALELNVVYPAIASALTLLYRRERWKDLPALFAVSGLYAIWNRTMAKPQSSPVYTLYWDSDLAGTLGAYLRMATGIWRPDLIRENPAWWTTAEWVAGVGLLAAIGYLLWRRERWIVFSLVWFFATLGPLLPLKMHVSDYYLTVPALGLAMAAGLAAARKPALALLPIAVYAAASGLWARKTVAYNYDRAETGKALFFGVLEASRLHPGKLILLTAVSSDQYWGVMNDNPFRLIDGLKLHLAPGGDENIEKHPELGDPGRYVLPGPAARVALEAGQAVVYSPAGGKLRNVTALWQGMAKDRWGGELSPIVDIGQPLLAGQLGKGWHQIEQSFRWSEGEASLRLGATADVREITIEAFRGHEDGKRGAVSITVFANGVAAGKWEMPRDDSSLAVSTPLPAATDRAKPIRIDLRIAPVLREDGSNGRELGLAFGKIGLR
ncbi:MAG: hypothetical protein HYX27_26865 [Acidobacteria bacterium]|nr:hypothetical protein [Acidobacteriota bacterium]